MKIAMIQMDVVHDKEKNIKHALDLIERACEEEIDMAVLPEMFCCPYSTSYFREYGEENGGKVQNALSGCAKKHGIYLIGGSLPEIDGDKVYNTSYVYDRSGKQIAKHRKAHLFDIDVEGGQRFFESDVLTAGENTTVFETEFGPMGLCICFDFRSQELARTMGNRGAKIIFVPGAFNMTTGPAHWEVLFRSRAIDNQLFTLGVAPARDENGEYVSYANSIAVDPWGTVIKRLGTGEEIGIVEPDLSRIDSIRRQLPIITSRKPALYD